MRQYCNQMSNFIIFRLYNWILSGPMDPKMGIGLTPYGYSPNGLSALYRLKKQNKTKLYNIDAS